MRTAWLDLAAGASGDMLLGALLDAGAPLDVVQAAVDAIAPGIEITVRKVQRNGVSATKADLRTRETSHSRTWLDIDRRLQQAELKTEVRSIAREAFSRLARAEAAVHSTRVEHIHFHEVGGLDAIGDIVGVAAAIDVLELAEVVASPVALGSGTVASAHGRLPVPVPAVLQLLADVAAPVYGSDEPYELCTPTGAALLAATVSHWSVLPPGKLITAGSGAGDRELNRLPNVVRIVVLEPLEMRPSSMPHPSALGVPITQEIILETNVDDLDPRVWPNVLAKLIGAGAADAWLTAITMKKGRPAHTLSVLVPAQCADNVRRIVFTETSAIGLRESTVIKWALDRHWVTVQVGSEPVRVKVAVMGGTVVNIQPEYEDIVGVADRSGQPIKTILAEAIAAAHAASSDPTSCAANRDLAQSDQGSLSR
jgi:pyridinium-3,5-bisthiocarboxylic acid mononucleotide nickel chelatase